MRAIRVSLVVVFFAVPLPAMAAAFIGGSPFAHVNPFFIDEGVPVVSTPLQVSQTAAAETLKVESPTNVGTKDICWDETVYESNGKPLADPKKGPNWEKCEEIKGDCSNPQKRALAGYVTYVDDFAVKTKRFQRCTKQPATLPGAHAVSLSDFQKIDSTKIADDPATQQQMSRELQKLGISESQANEIATKDPGNAYSLLSATAHGNTEAAENIARDVLKLDASIVSKVGEIQSYEYETDFGGGGDLQVAESGSGGTSNVCGFPDSAGKLMLPESGCGANNGSGKYQGPLQFSCETWAGYANTTRNSEYADCKYRMDPAISSRVSNQYYNDIMKPKYGAQCENAGITWDSCTLAIHAWGEGGFQRMLSSAHTNPDASATAWCGGSCTNKPYLDKYNPDGTIKGAFASLDQFMTCGWSCKSPGIATPNKYLGSTGGTYVEYTPWENIGNPVVAQSSRTTYERTPTTEYRSSGKSSPFSSNSMMMSMMLMGPLQNLMNSFRQSVPATSQTQQSTQPPPPATLSLSVTPTTIKKGDSISVRWTSNATLLSPPCQLTQNGTLIGQGPTGTLAVITSSTTPAALVFTLDCRAAGSGAPLQQSATVSVQ